MFSDEDYVAVITRSCQIKIAIIQDDETENGQRKLLNFGHTIGHAVEVLSLETNNPLLHGEAISIGMVAEAKLSQLSGMISEEDVVFIRDALVGMGLPVTISDIHVEHIVEKMRSDKKNEKGQINFTLLQAIGKAVCDQHAPDNYITQAIASITK
jgi:3-dehydroquinate synthase